MIEYLASDIKDSFTIKSDLSGGKLVYVHFLPKKISVSNNLKELLLKGSEEIRISSYGMSFLLQSGMVPAPHSVYENIFIIGIGGKFLVSSQEGMFSWKYEHVFPFTVPKESKEATKSFSKDILGMIAQNIKENIDSSKPSFLFHSSGKDSNIIALALKENNMQEDVTLVSHESKGEYDESKLSQQIAQELGFKHHILREVDKLDLNHINHIKEFFKEMPHPSCDNVTIALSLYSYEYSELKESNIITGDGNDSYFMPPLNFRDRILIYIVSFLSYLRVFNFKIPSEKIINPLMKTAIEWHRLEGFNMYESVKIFPTSINTYKFWKKKSKNRFRLNTINFKTDSYFSNAIERIHIMKMRLATYSLNSKLILPFMASEIANKFWSLPVSRLFNEATGENKVILKDILHDEINLDSNKIGKKGYNYDSFSLIRNNWDWVKEEILNCDLWNGLNVVPMIDRLKKNSGNVSIEERLATRLLYRLLLISLWKNHSKYIN